MVFCSLNAAGHGAADEKLACPPNARQVLTLECDGSYGLAGPHVRRAIRAITVMSKNVLDSAHGGGEAAVHSYFFRLTQQSIAAHCDREVRRESCVCEPVPTIDQINGISSLSEAIVVRTLRNPTLVIDTAALPN